LLRALEQAPEQPLIHLCLGVSYLHRAMSRQTDNREHQIAQVSRLSNPRAACERPEL